ncbi:MAG: hypothetical protein H0T47_01790 [Planctomycetaceae bacterium]|nr:hypothetical protein [Planctomycetaceae bacterium]
MSRGRRFPEIAGRYVFGDNQSGRIWTLDPADPERKSPLLQLPFLKAGSTLTSISADRQGNLFFTNFSSRPAVYRLTRSARMKFPDRLSETGFFADLTSLRAAEGFVDYDVSVPLWSDGLAKRRWLRLPPGAEIDNTTSSEAWSFPAGTVFIKHFETPDGDVADGPPRKVETRVLLVKQGGHVVGATYLWNREGTDANLQLERRTLPLRWARKSPAAEVAFDYHVPGFRDCVVCHNRENPVLGVNPLQLNHAVDGENQLVTLSRIGVFAKRYDPPAATSLAILSPLDDPDATLDHRARSYLHANCSFCHSGEGTRRIDLDLRLSDPSRPAAFVGESPRLSYVQVDGRASRHLISPGDPEDSAIYRRLRTTHREVAMPYLGRVRPDAAALRVMRDWIDSLGKEGAAVAAQEKVSAPPAAARN